jgi:hypothetical protein
MGKRARKTGMSVTEWRRKFAEAVHYCKAHKAPGERIQDCVRKYLSAHK